MTTKQRKVPQSVFPKGTTEWREWVLNRDRVGHEPGALTTRPRCRLNENFYSDKTKGPLPLRAWKRAFFLSFIDLRLKRAVKIEASAKKKQ